MVNVVSSLLLGLLCRSGSAIGLTDPSPIKTSAGDCMTLITEPRTDDIETRTALCMGQGKGSYTFGMKVTHNDANATFAIYDNACRILETFPTPPCPGPFVVEAN